MTRRWPGDRWRDDDRGIATVVALALAGLLVAVAVGGLVIGELVLVRQRTATTADLAALAAAGRLLAGAGAAEACGRALVVARAGGSDLVGCEVAGLEATVTVSSDPPPLVRRVLVGTGRAGARVAVRSRAGPGSPGVR